MSENKIDTRPITQKDMLDLAFNHADVLDPIRVIATFAERSNWHQVHDENGCNWAMRGPTCPPYELAQQALKRLGING